MKLRNLQNVPLEISSLFVYTEQKLEHALNTALTSSSTTATSTSGAESYVKHKQFKVTIYGISVSGSDEDDNECGITVKVTQDTTVLQAIEEVRLFVSF